MVSGDQGADKWRIQFGICAGNTIKYPQKDSVFQATNNINNSWRINEDNLLRSLYKLTVMQHFRRTRNMAE